MDTPEEAKPKAAHCTLNVLIVDDEPFLTGIFRYALEREGCTVMMAENGDKGVRTAKKEMPDVILMDLQMPMMDGFEAINRLKADPKTKAIPILVLSGLNQKEDIERAMSIGAFGYLMKSKTLPHDAISKIYEVTGTKRRPIPPPNLKPME